MWILQLGKAVAVDEGVELFTRFTKGTLMRGQGKVALEVVGVKDRVHGIAAAFGSGGENRGKTDDFTAIVVDGFDGGFCGIARCDRHGEDQYVLTADHGGDIVTEHQLRADGMLGGYHVDGLMRVDVDEIVLGQFSRKTGADHLGGVEAKNGVDHVRGVTVITAKRFRDGGGFGQSAFLRGNVDIIITV